MGFCINHKNWVLQGLVNNRSRDFFLESAGQRDYPSELPLFENSIPYCFSRADSGAILRLKPFENGQFWDKRLHAPGERSGS
jgi:hypothetical protein